MLSNATYSDKIRAGIDLTEKLKLQHFEDAIRIGNIALQVAVKNNDQRAVAELKQRIGEAYYFKGDYEKAAAMFYASIKAFEKANEPHGLAMSYNVLARLYRKTRDLKLSLVNYDKAMEIFRSLNDSAGISMIYNESGVVFEYQNEFEKAAERYTASLQMDQRRKDSVGICYALSNLAGLYVLQNKFAEAEQYLLQSLRTRKHMKDSFALALNYSDLGSAYLSARSYGVAKAFIDSSNVLANGLDYPELKSANFELLGKIANAEGDFKTALQYFQLRAVIRDSIFSIEKTSRISELNTKYETEKKERKIQEQEDMISRRNIMVVASVAFACLIALLAYAGYRRYKLKQEIRSRDEILKQQDLATQAVMAAEEAERKRIATDLHDGVGQIMSAAKMNLSAYENLAKFNTPDERSSFEKSIYLVDEACKEVRAVSHNMMPNALLKNSLAAAIRDFINKLDHRSLKVHLFTEGFDEALNSNTETVLYRVIQECVNNVIKHSGADTLDISLIKSEREITATIEDNGKGFETNKQSEGIGLKNMRTRIEFLKGTIDFDSAPDRGTLVMLHIPVAGE